MKDIQRESRIKLWIIETPTVELAVLVVFDETMVRISRKRQWVQPERIHRWPRQDRQIRFRCCKMR